MSYTQARTRRLITSTEGPREVLVEDFQQVKTAPDGRLRGILRSNDNGIDSDDMFTVADEDTMKILVKADDQRKFVKTYCTIAPDSSEDQDHHPEILSARTE